jgi:hypothetical protein
LLALTLARFLLLKKGDTDNAFSPTAEIDQIWHACILETELYAQVQRVLGCTVAHSSRTAGDDMEPARAEGRMRMQKAYYARFGAHPLGCAAAAVVAAANGAAAPDAAAPAPDAYLQAPMHIRVKPVGGLQPLSLDVRTCASVDELKYEIHKVTGLDPDELRVLFAGRPMADGRLLSDYNVHDGSTVDMALRLRGC